MTRDVLEGLDSLVGGCEFIKGAVLVHRRELNNTLQATIVKVNPEAAVTHVACVRAYCSDTGSGCKAVLRQAR